MLIDFATVPQPSDRESAEAFVRWCCRNVGWGFHPDDPFDGYEEKGTRERSFTPEDASALQARMDAAHRILGSETYEVGLDEFAAMRQGRG